MVGLGHGGGVATHVIANFSSFKRYLSKPAALGIVGVFVAILAASFFIQEEDKGKGGNPARRASQAVVQAPSARSPLWPIKSQRN